MLTLAKRNRFFPTLWDDMFNLDWPELGNGVTSNLPAVNVKENDDNFTVELAAPGMSKDDFKIKLDHNLLTISSEKEMKNEEKDDEGRYTRREFSYRSFSRSFRLPETVESDKIDAKYHDGVLYLTLPKMEAAKPKTPRLIEIS